MDIILKYAPSVLFGITLAAYGADLAEIKDWLLLLGFTSLMAGRDIYFGN